MHSFDKFVILSHLSSERSPFVIIVEELSRKVFKRFGYLCTHTYV